MTNKPTKKEKTLWDKIWDYNINYGFAVFHHAKKEDKIEMEFSMDFDVSEYEQELQAKHMALTLKRNLGHLAPVFLKEFAKGIK